MTPGVGRGISDDRSLERQMGCMAGFLQLFDRHQIHAGKRLYASRRLPSSPVAGSTSPSERSEVSSVSFVKEIQRSPSLEACPSLPESCGPAQSPARLSLPFPLPVSDFKDGQRSSWKLREAPRLSLDSRAVVDARGKLRPREIRTAASGNQSGVSEVADESERQRRSPSVVARLMGLEALPESGGDGGGERGEPKRAELRRSASESRIPRDYRFVDVSSFQKPYPGAAISGTEFFGADFGEFRLRFAKPDTPSRIPLPPLQRKSFFDAQDFFPEPPKRTGSLYGEIERRLRMRGIDEPAKDLETLKQILEALQLKGLLRSNPSEPPINGRRNLIYDDHHHHPKISATNSPVVVWKPTVKPSRRPASERPPIPFRSNPARGVSAVEGAVPLARARRDRAEVERKPIGINDRRTRTPSLPEPSSPARRRALNAEPPTSPQPQRIISGVQSPKASPKRVGPDPLAVRSPRNRRMPYEISPKGMIYSLAEDDTSTTVSESSISSSAQLDFERSRSEEYRAEKSLLERCDKLLHSIAAITGAEQVTGVEQQPSPVSVLDSSFLCDESSPSPVTKRAIDFKDQPLEWEVHASTAGPAIRSNGADGPDAEDHDYVYVSQIVRVSDRLRDPSDVYAVLEKRHQAASPALSKVSRLHRRLVFDTVAEILDRKRHASPWEAFTSARSLPGAAALLVREVWVEVRRIQEQVHPADDFNDVTCGAIHKDLAGDRGWGPRPAPEMSDAVLHIERQIFKDLVAETIRDLAELSSRPPPRPRRKLVF
uniref:Protein LONGIFOLIA 2 n=1 Tax=Elaeis guineensis var. tenera TaxID=51953 RepID=A0A6I9RUJ0_ELAGV|nr:protein LONGIFOLIA 2 [Elaeis guineensis]